MILERAQRDSRREWLDLKSLIRYADVSERTLREWIHRAVNPLPAVRVGSKILIRRTTFDAWLEAHRLTPAECVDVNAITNELLADVSGGN